ncbi:nucleotidyl transferase AbiEii/AbiGii toxin family protein [Mycobacterium saskatchewanense]|uniref:nucleotidyl transferase AbiEii/AbiGii toxin family protein n=1 Tax=Mycobacterium saskatchewanense TaxID=220927 RepID=UPI0021F276C0|nr:nucleotidyl transferase AbiEii/AbiGii toxin family protein [Mycobacterium saskatchewanense]
MPHSHGDVARDPRRGLYSGVRVATDCGIASAVIELRLDVNFGDSVTPAPQQIDLPALRPDHPPIRILGYPLETVLAETISTAIGLGPPNTRVRDYADIYTLTGDRDISIGRWRRADRNCQLPRH